MLREWLNTNNIKVNEWFTNELFNLVIDEKVQSFCYVHPKDGKIITQGMTLALNSEEIKLSKEGVWFCFEFGGNIYYTENPNEIKFTLFKYLGKNDFQVDLDFCNLGLHGRYELLNGSGTYEEWCKKAKFLGQSALGICEFHTLGGIIHFQTACTDNKIKSILGEEFLIESKEKGNFFKLKLYCKNKDGWRSLLKLNKIINVDKVEESNPSIKFESLLTLSGVIMVVGENTKKHNLAELKVLAHKYKGDIYYQFDTLEYKSNEPDLLHLNQQKYYLSTLKDLIPPILINDSYYIDKELFYIKDKLNQLGNMGHQKETIDQHFKSLDEDLEILDSLFEESDLRLESLFTEMVENTIKVVEACEFKIEFHNKHLPEYPFKDLGFNTKYELFWKLIEEGIERKIVSFDSKDVDIYIERIDQEFDLIDRGGFIDYFLILWDILKWCKENNILTGPGRGSAAGSLISYLLNIVEVDPIEHGLLFERFLNEGRIKKGIPDIDIDFEAEKKTLVHEYLKSKYGNEQVCFAGAYRGMKIKSCIKDLGRGVIEYTYLNNVSNSLHFSESKNGELKYLFAEALNNPTFKEFTKRYPELINVTGEILNQPRSRSIHPSAILIMPKEENGIKKTIFDWVPIRKEGEEYISEWEGAELEMVGFLKEDILSLGQLDKINFILNLIKETTGEVIDLYSIQIDDSNVMALFKEGINGDVFQFGSEGLKSYCKEVKPENLVELMNIVALYRPGPKSSGAHNTYVHIKNGTKVPEYDFMLKEVTKDTFGLYIYQEQVMKAVQVLGGFSPSDTDDVRKAMGKKKEEVVAPYRKQFIDSAISKGCDEIEAETIWKKLEVFSGYGFNKSHSAAYAYLGYLSQYLKYYHPLQFWAAALQFAEEDSDIGNYLMEIESQFPQIKVVAVDINSSSDQISISQSKNEIYWSIKRVAFLGEVALKAIFDSRAKNREYFSFEEFIVGIKDYKGDINKRVIMNLIYSGAFDSIGVIGDPISEPRERTQIIDKYFELLQLTPPRVQKPNWWWIFKQRDISGFGTVNYRELFKNYPGLVGKAGAGKPNFNFYDANRLSNLKEANVVLGGIILEVTERTSTKGVWGSILVDFNNFQVKICIWNEEWINLKYKEKLMEQEGKLLLIEGYLKNKDGWLSIHSRGDKTPANIEVIDLELDLKISETTQKKIYQMGDRREFKDGPYEVIFKDGDTYRWRKIK